MIEIHFEDSARTIRVEAGRVFTEICDDYDTPIFFGCRAASCATCLIEVTQGLEHLSPITDGEEVILSLMAQGNSRARLACQCRVNGSIAVKVLAPE